MTGLIRKGLNDLKKLLTTCNSLTSISELLQGCPNKFETYML